MCVRRVSGFRRLTNRCEERYCLMSDKCLHGSEYSFAFIGIAISKFIFPDII